MTADVLTLPTTRAITIRALTRDERQEELIHLAWEHEVGVAPSIRRTALVVAACAHESHTGPAAVAAWETYRAEYGRALSVALGEPEWADLQPGLAEADMNEALRCLLDGGEMYSTSWGGRSR